MTDSVIDGYINAQDEGIRERLHLVRNAIREAIPEAEECISYKMPTYRKGRNIIHFAAAKNHIGIYPGPETIEAFADRLKGYKTSKGALQLPDSRELPLDLIREIAQYSYERYSK
ncbi:MAG: DUF1801 domain-containing protein [Solobacterium sp.]|nr:DUF1801 domain-containing protein [Solobacterium sp.]